MPVLCTPCTGKSFAVPTSDCKVVHKGGFEGPLHVHCAIQLTSANVTSFLAGDAIPISGTGWGNPIYVGTTITLQDAIDAKLVTYVSRQIMGSLAKGSTQTEQTSSCNTPSITSVDWTFAFNTKSFSVDGMSVDCAVWNERIANQGREHIIVPTCNSPKEAYVLYAGEWSLSDIDATVPEDGTKAIQMKGFTVTTNAAGWLCPVLFPSYNSLIF